MYFLNSVTLLCMPLREAVTQNSANPSFVLTTEAPPPFCLALPLRIVPACIVHGPGSW